MTAQPSPDRGKVYAEFIHAELEREHQRRASAQSRASSLSGFGTGAVGLAGGGFIIAFGQGRTLTLAAALLVLATLVAFIFSIGLAARVFAIGHTYTVSSADGYRQMVGPRWAVDSEEAARRATAAFAFRTLTTLRNGNNRSATLLLWAGYLQVVGLATLGLALVIEFLGALA